MTAWDSLRGEFATCLKDIQFTCGKVRALPQEEGFARFVALGLDVYRTAGQIFFIGNGASASMSSHFAADVGKNAGIRTQVFTDAALLSALGNDIGFEAIYAEPLHRHADKNDVLVAVSSSGNSRNIIAAAQAARECGCRVVTLSAMRSDNALRRLGQVNIYVPAATYCLAESAHALLLHHWVDLLIAEVRGQNSAGLTTSIHEVCHG